MIIVKNNLNETRQGKVLFKTESNHVCCRFSPRLQEKSLTTLFYFDLLTKKQISWNCGRMSVIDGWEIKEIDITDIISVK